MGQFLSWGRYPARPQSPHLIYWQEDVQTALADIAVLHRGGALPFGCGRSYGDSCLAQSDHVLAMRGMDRLLIADWETGVVRAEAGLTLEELIHVALPLGWFLPVTPGTKFVTLGGAVANDVHGKNHHVMGTFGCHVRHLVVHRSDEGIVDCSPTQRTDLFEATVGGLGLTGVILAVELQLRRVSSSEIEQRSIRFDDLDEFFELSRAHDLSYEYTVAWIDLAGSTQAGRGHFIAGNHAQEGPLRVASPGQLHMALDLPFSLVNRFSVRAFNTLYFHRQRKKESLSRVGYDTFFYPLDRLRLWNRLYGKQGFQQYQCVIPQRHAREAIRAVTHEISASGTGSFLSVLKQCGSVPSPGLLSFPLHGVSLALDFPQCDQLSGGLFKRLDAMVHEAGGRLYAAKDAHMQSGDFKRAYPKWKRVEAMRDPLLMSRFWQRMTSE